MLPTLRPRSWHGDGFALRTPTPLVLRLPPPLAATPFSMLFPYAWARSLRVAATGGEQAYRGDGGWGAPSDPMLPLPLKKKLVAWVSSSGSASDTLRTESERCSGDIRRPPSLPQKDEDRVGVGEADTSPMLAGAGDCGGTTGGGIVPLNDGDGDDPPTTVDPSSRLLLIDEEFPLFLGDGTEGRRW